MGMFTPLGYWTCGNPEMCLLATKGSPKRLSKSVKQLVISPRREHSRKLMRFIIILKIYLMEHMLNYLQEQKEKVGIVGEIR